MRTAAQPGTTGAVRATPGSHSQVLKLRRRALAGYRITDRIPLAAAKSGAARGVATSGAAVVNIAQDVLADTKCAFLLPVLYFWVFFVGARVGERSQSAHDSTTDGVDGPCSRHRRAIWWSLLKTILRGATHDADYHRRP